MVSFVRKTVVLRPILGVAPGMALAIAIGIIAIGVFAAILLDDMTGGPGARVQDSPDQSSAISTDAFVPPAATIARSTSTDSATPWKTFAAPYPLHDPAPRMAIIVIDDGSDATAALNAMRLSGPVTLAIASTADAADRRAEAARRFGREVLLLLPMQAEKTFDTAPNPIAIHVPRTELLRRLDWNLAQIDGYVGVMNQYGEATTRDAGTMRTVMEVIQAKGYGFIDSRAHKDSLASAVARRMDVPAGDLTVAIPAGADTADLGAGLSVGLRHAERWGTAIVTVPADRRLIEALGQWMTEQQSDVKLAPITAVIGRSRSGKT